MCVHRWVVALGAMCLAAPVAAQTASPEGFSLSGTTRLRVEAIDGQARAGFDKADDLINLRTTLMAQYRNGPVRFVAELWDSRVYGDDRGTPVSTGEVNALELVQIFAEVKAPGFAGAGSGATITAGRFVMNLGSRRLIAADDYRNTTNGSVKPTWQAGQGGDTVTYEPEIESVTAQPISSLQLVAGGNPAGGADVRQLPIVPAQRGRPANRARDRHLP